MKHFSRWLIGAVVVLGLAGIGYLWWQGQQGAALVPITAAPAPEPAPVVAEPAPAASAATPEHYPIEAIAPATENPPAALTDSGSAVREALIALLGREQVLSFLDLSDFAHRVVATVDNLGRTYAAARLWPVVPAPARFLVVERDGATYMADGNMDRYAAFVRFASSIDSGAAVALYVRMYPMLQQAYVELGYPGKYFNNRLVEVIDLLLATPELTEPIRLTLTKVRGPVVAQRPWVRYEYWDPTLEARPAGQKMLMRMGPKNARQLKAKLRELRQRLTKSGVTG